MFGTCGPNSGDVVLDNILLSPATPHLDEEIHISLVGHVPSEASSPLNASALTVAGSVNFCRRFEDCMRVFSYSTSLCSLLNESGLDCENMQPGDSFVASRKWFIPLGIVRGTYNLQVHLKKAGGEVAACYEYSGVMMLATLLLNKGRDIRDAIVAFVIAASSAYALGGIFPAMSRGLLPQISGFLFIGMIVGPYSSNLVSHMHIYLIGGFINRISLAFIGGAAGAEIFLPEFRALLLPMALQVLMISIGTLTLCAGGLLLLSTHGILHVPALELQDSLGAKLAVSLLAGSLMTARSPASAIAVIAELRCSESTAAKMALGITVLSDIVVLVLFSLCSQVVRIATRGGALGPGVLLGATVEIGASVLLGLAAGQLLRLALPEKDDPEAEPGDDASDASAGSEPWTPRSARGLEPLSPRSPSLAPGGRCVAACGGLPESTVVGLRGLALLSILTATFYCAEEADIWTGGRLRLEPLLACTVASCWCGHDERRRFNLLQSLSFWTPHVLLPFFTLAGASLELPGLAKVAPAALTLVALRMGANAAGSFSAGLLTRRLVPEVNTSDATVNLTWLTLLAQAGVTLGLVLEVQAQDDFNLWSRQFGILILGVVMLNQLLGPIACRLGLTRLLAEEQPDGSNDSASDGETLSSSGEERKPHLVPPTAGVKRRKASIQPYDTLVRNTRNASENMIAVVKEEKRP